MSITSSKLKQFHQYLDKVIQLQQQLKEIDLNSREIFVQAVQIMRETGMGDFEISELTREYLRNKIPERSLRLYLSELKPEESQNNVTGETGNADIDENNDTEEEPTEILITTEGSQTNNYEEEQDEEPTPLELANIKIAQLEDALHQTEQFKPGTLFLGTKSKEEIQEIKDELASGTTIIQTPLDYENEVFDWLGKRDNGVNYYWFPNYGIELFRNRILTDLKGRGVKTFKRLYFEV
jgi:hypothetical protein